MFLDPNIGYEKKLTNYMLYNHYLIGPLMLFNAILLPFIVIFSSFHFLMPFIAAIAVVGILTEAISASAYVRYLSETGSAWQALKLMLKEMVKGFFVWVGTIPHYWNGIKDVAMQKFFIPELQKNHRSIALYRPRKAARGEDGGRFCRAF